MHKLIKKETTEYIVPENQEDVKKILEKQDKKESEEKETDVIEDYEESMDEFADSLGGHHETLKKDLKASEIKALGD